MAYPKLEFFYFSTCPFCVRVMDVLDKHQIKVKYQDILSDKAALDRLIEDTGRRTVPCLYIDNMPMHESADIIHWLEENVDKVEKNS